MNTEDIKRMLDEIDLLMINHLDNNHFLTDKNTILKISNMIDKIQNEIIRNKEKEDLNLEKRFNIVATAFMTAKDKENVLNGEASKYFKWLENGKENARKEELSFKEALNTARYEDESGHERSAKVASALAKSYTFGNGNPENLPVKQTGFNNWFNKLKTKIKQLFNGNSNSKNDNSDTSSMQEHPNPTRVDEEYANNEKRNEFVRKSKNRA